MFQEYVEHSGEERADAAVGFLDDVDDVLAVYTTVDDDTTFERTSTFADVDRTGDVKNGSRGGHAAGSAGDATSMFRDDWDTYNPYGETYIRVPLIIVYSIVCFACVIGKRGFLLEVISENIL